MGIGFVVACPLESYKNSKQMQGVVSPLRVTLILIVPHLQVKRTGIQCGTPAQRKLERPVFQPRDRGEVFWNTALLSIEQTNSLLRHEYEYKVTDITRNNIDTAMLCQP